MHSRLFNKAYSRAFVLLVKAAEELEALLLRRRICRQLFPVPPLEYIWPLGGRNASRAEPSSQLCKHSSTTELRSSVTLEKFETVARLAVGESPEWRRVAEWTLEPCGLSKEIRFPNGMDRRQLPRGKGLAIAPTMVARPRDDIFDVAGSGEIS